MGSNIEKEKKQFENEMKKKEKQNLLKTKIEDDEILKISKRELRQMNIIIYIKIKFLRVLFHFYVK